MKNLLKLEEFFLFGLSLFLFSKLNYPWWLYAVLFFAPDLSMVGYFGGPKMGATVYNFIHHKGLAIGFYILGAILMDPALQFTGLILLGHSSLDRVFGYGLKFSDSFNSTHLGRIGKQQA
jgi:Domain of unknown function (DUF4260)